MHPEIAKRFQAIEARRTAFVERVRTLSPEQQVTRPSGKGFSPIEVVMHFALAERSNVALMRKNLPPALEGRKPKTTFLFRTTVAKMSNPTKPLATVGYMIPKGQPTLEEAEKAFESVRKETAEVLEMVKDPDQPFIKFLFFFGIGSAFDYFELIESHMTYHEVRFPQV